MKRYILLAAIFFSAASARAEYCREFTETIVVGGRKEQGYGTACLQADGAWQIQEPARFDSGYRAADNTPQTIIIRDEPRPIIIRERPRYRHHHTHRGGRYYYGASWWEPRDHHHRSERWRSRW